MISQRDEDSNGENQRAWTMDICTLMLAVTSTYLSNVQHLYCPSMTREFLHIQKAKNA